MEGGSGGESGGMAGRCGGGWVGLTQELSPPRGVARETAESTPTPEPNPVPRASQRRAGMGEARALAVNRGVYRELCPRAYYPPARREKLLSASHPPTPHHFALSPAFPAARGCARSHSSVFCQRAGSIRFCDTSLCLLELCLHICQHFICNHIIRFKSAEKCLVEFGIYRKMKLSDF